MANTTDPLAAALKRIARDLRSRRSDFALVGGLAVSLRAEERLTRDIDLAVAVDGDPQAEKLIRDLLGAGYTLETALEQTKTGRLATARLLPPRSLPGRPLVDLLFASCGIEPEIVGAAEILVVLPGSRVRVATTGHLIAMKVLSQSEERPQDRQDLLGLIRVASEADLASAANALRLIERRGFHRKKPLAAILEKAIRLAHRPPRGLRER